MTACWCSRKSIVKYHIVTNTNFRLRSKPLAVSCILLYSHPFFCSRVFLFSVQLYQAKVGVEPLYHLLL